ncbi:hypothetical protein [uncultured Paracoccus sp.]|uniref:hypothetical protein n=1 Tax=uncultured Paracoccus sp. TaxID=189685 RepID=UPI0025D81D52|nr:hypothetical protein [uncultured Paracoccus sp.]
MATEDIRSMADEVAALMVSRFGGARRGERVNLSAMMRRRGGALPRKLRRQAHLLAQADVLVDAPRLARQQDMARLVRAHDVLLRHLRPLGAASRWKGGAISVGASLALALLLIGALAVWLMVLRGHV